MARSRLDRDHVSAGRRLDQPFRRPGGAGDQFRPLKSIGRRRERSAHAGRRRVSRAQYSTVTGGHNSA